MSKGNSKPHLITKSPIGTKTFVGRIDDTGRMDIGVQKPNYPEEYWVNIPVSQALQFAINIIQRIKRSYYPEDE